MATRDLRVDIVGDASGVQGAFRDAERSAGGFGKKLGGLGKFAAAGVAGIAAGVGAGLVGLGPQVLGAAAAMETLDAKAKTVFGDQLGVVQKWAKGNAAAMGLTGKEAVGLSAGFADLLIPMGFTRDAAAKMSTDVVGLSGALSQWSGGQYTAAEVADTLSAAMLGETDGLKSLGISISAADVEARLLAKGQDKLTGAAQQQAQAQAIQALIMEKSTDAQAAYKTSSGTLLGQQQKLSAQVKELKDKAIGALIPVLLRAGNYVSGTVVPAFQRLAAGFRSGEGTGGRFRAILDKVKTTFQQNKPQIMQFLGALRSVAGFIVTRVVPVFVDFFVAKFRLAMGAVARLVDAFNAIKLPILGVFVSISRAFLDVVGGLVQGAAKAFGWVPGIGQKLQGAADQFAVFARQANAALDTIEKERVIQLRIQRSGEAIASGAQSISEGGTTGRTARGGNSPAAAPPARRPPTGRSRNNESRVIQTTVMLNDRVLATATNAVNAGSKSRGGTGSR